MPRDESLSDLRVVTEPLGGSPLSLAAQRDGVAEGWYHARPARAAEWRQRAATVAGRFVAGDWFAGLEPALSASGAAADRLRRVANARGVVVTSGQQPGLFGGPVYTFSKALSALALADELEVRIGLPVAPVFWGATDDADFDEASWTKVVLDGGVVRLALREAPPPGTPMSATPVGDVGEQLGQLERACGSAAFGAAVDAARRAYGPAATVGDAFVGFLRALLEPLGIAVLDASHPAVRRQGAEVLRAALRRAGDVAAALEARADELRAAGFEPQVVGMEDLSLVFDLNGGRKRRIPVAEAPAVAGADPATLGPNVLLRPVLEAFVLPTVAYCAGPAELAYFAQVSAVADALDLERPLAVPRWSGTIIEPHVGRLIERFGVRHADLRDPNALEGVLARAALPGAVVAAVAQIRQAVERAAAALETDPDASALVPTAAVAGAKGAILLRLQRLERRYVAAVKRREADLMRQVGTVRAHLFPDGERQERALNFVPMLARHGAALLEAMRVAAAAHAAAAVESRPHGATPPRQAAAQERRRP